MTTTTVWSEGTSCSNAKTIVTRGRTEFSPKSSFDFYCVDPSTTTACRRRRGTILLVSAVVCGGRPFVVSPSCSMARRVRFWMDDPVVVVSSWLSRTFNGSKACENIVVNCCHFPPLLLGRMNNVLGEFECLGQFITKCFVNYHVCLILFFVELFFT